MWEICKSGCMSNESWSVQREINPLGKEVRNPITRIAGRRETKVLESIDKEMYSMFVSLAGRNESERIGGPESVKPRKPSRQPNGEGSMDNRNLNETIESFRRGGSGGMQTRTHQPTGETLLVPCRNVWSKVRCITGSTGKIAEDERVADGFVVTLKRGNSRGVKEPCCCNSSNKMGGGMR